VVVEESTNPILSVRSVALERLLVLTLAVFAAAAAGLIWFATRISSRIRRLRDEAETAIDARGRIARLVTAQDAGDELGDLSRSFSAMLGKLSQHHAYLESMASRLSHELRTPIAVVRSSLENLKLAPPTAASTSSAPRKPEAPRHDPHAHERGDAPRAGPRLGRARALRPGRGRRGLRRRLPARVPGRAFEPRCRPVRGRERLARPRRAAARQARRQRGRLLARGRADTVSLSAAGGAAALEVANQGAPLPDAMRGKLFDSMVSVRAGHEGKSGEPHLGLGLYVARLIAEFHGGRDPRGKSLIGGGVSVTATSDSRRIRQDVGGRTTTWTTSTTTC